MNSITLTFGDETNITSTEKFTQFDYGQQIIFADLELPTPFECHLSNVKLGKAVTVIGENNVIEVPNELLSTGLPLYGWVFLHESVNDGETEYTFKIKVTRRAIPKDTITPEQQSAITRAIALLQYPIDNIEEIVNEALSYTTVTLEELQAMDAELKGDVATANTNIATNASDIVTLNARVDNLAQLEEGSTTGDAELIDGRVGADGATYTNIGGAIRGQVGDLKTKLDVVANQPSFDFVIGKAIGSSGAEGNANYGSHTQQIPVSGGDLVYRVTPAKDANNETLINHLCQYKDGVFQSRTSLIYGHIVAVDADTTSIAFNFSRPSTSGVVMTQADIDTYFSVLVYRKASPEAEQDTRLISCTISQTQASTVYNSLLSNVPSNTFIWANRSWWNDAPNDSKNYFYIMSLAANKTRGKMLSKGTQLAFFPDSGALYMRRLKSNAWTDWVKEFDEEVYTPKYTPMYNETYNMLSLNVSRIKRGGTAVYSTLPMETHVLGQTDYYGQGDAIDSVVYSSVWRDGLDVYRNLTLETFYSALANPASVLYTKTYTDKNIANAHAWYGGVCSTCVTKILGIRQYKTTSQLEDFIKPKEIADYREVTVGDALLKSGHIAFISQVYMDADGAINGFAVSEQTSEQSAGFRTRIIALKDFKAFLDNNGFTVMTLKEPAPSITLGDPKFNEEIIFERGNNTYITEDDISDGAWFYIPNADTVYYKKGDGEFTSVSVSSLTSKTVNEVTVYDLASCFDGAGDYIFTNDISADKKCLIKMITLGEINLSGNILTLSGWENCVPYNYYIVAERVRTSAEQDYAMNPSEGYYCTYINKCGGIDVGSDETLTTVEIPADDISGLNRYKLWIEYDTGVGYKQGFSNLIVL